MHDDLPADWDTELLDDLVGPEPDWDDDPAGDVPDGIDHAQTLMARLARTTRDLNEVLAVADAEHGRVNEAAQRAHDRVNAVYDDRVAILERQASWLRQRLTSYLAAVLARNPKAPKTLHLTYGQLTARGQQPTWDIDDKKLIAWTAEHAPDLLRHPPVEVDRHALKAAAAVKDGLAVIDGVAVPGVTVEARDDKFDASPSIPEI